MKMKLLLFYFVLGIANYAQCAETKVTAKSSIATDEPPATAAATAAAVAAEARPDGTLAAATTATSVTTAAAIAANADKEAPSQTKDKRQIGRKDTAVYPNHRSSNSASSNSGSADSSDDDPEVPQETIYGAKPNQFLIRPIAPHQHQQHEEHQQHQAHLRNYPATIRPHSTQLLEQSQEIQHYAYLQEITRNQPKSSVAAQLVGKSQTSAPKKPYRTHTQAPIPSQSQSPYGNDDEAEQRYVVAVQPQQQQQQQHQHQAQPQPRHFQPTILPTSQPFQISQAPSQQKHQHQNQRPQQQHQQQGQLVQQDQQQYQIIPEEQFLRLIEEELQARAYHAAQYRQQVQQQQADADRGDGGGSTATTNKAQQRQEQHQQVQTERSGPGLGQYRQRIAQEPAAAAEYVQYVPRHRGGPKYLPLSQSHSQQPQPQPHEPQTVEEDEQQQLQQQQQHLQHLQQLQSHPDIPPQLAYYQPQLSGYGGYKTLPNHPLAKSSLENEIEKLLAANKPSSVTGSNLRVIDSSNEPSGLVRQQQLQSQPQRAPRPSSRPKTVAFSGSTPNSLLDANKQPFIPSLFQFSNFQAPTPIYPTTLPQQTHQSPRGEVKKLGPVIYPTQPSAGAQLAPSQYYYQEAAPSAKPKPYRPKLQQQQQQKLHSREKEVLKYTQAPLIYADYDRQQQSQGQSQSQTGPVQFHPSPTDPIKQQQQQPLLPSPSPPPTPADFRQYVLPAPAPSQSSIFVSQGTGIGTPSRPTPTAAAVTHKPKTIEDVKQLHLPQPGGKPLTQAEFQALLDAGYPVTAVPVPVPVPYEQYVKEHPDYRSPPVDYAHLMRFAQQQFAPHHRQLALLQLQRPLGVASEPSVKIISAASPSAGGRLTHVRGADPKRQPRQEQETKVEGAKDGEQL